QAIDNGGDARNATHAAFQTALDRGIGHLRLDVPERQAGGRERTEHVVGDPAGELLELLGAARYQLVALVDDAMVVRQRAQRQPGGGGGKKRAQKVEKQRYPRRAAVPLLDLHGQALAVGRVELDVAARAVAGTVDRLMACLGSGSAGVAGAQLAQE